MKDDVLDTKAFAELVDKEIKDFEEIGVTNTVLGFGVTSRDEEDDPVKLAEKSRTKRMMLPSIRCSNILGTRRKNKREVNFI